MWAIPDLFSEFRGSLLRSTPLQPRVALVFTNVRYCDPNIFLQYKFPASQCLYDVYLTELPTTPRRGLLGEELFDVCFSVHALDVPACEMLGAYRLDSA
jgi:hypothetical protein